MNAVCLIHRVAWFYDGFAADRSLAELVSSYSFFAPGAITGVALSMRMSRHFGSSATYQKVKVAALVGLHDVVDV